MREWKVWRCGDETHYETSVGGVGLTVVKQELGPYLFSHGPIVDNWLESTDIESAKDEAVRIVTRYCNVGCEFCPGPCTLVCELRKLVQTCSLMEQRIYQLEHGWDVPPTAMSLAGRTQWLRERTITPNIAAVLADFCESQLGKLQPEKDVVYRKALAELRGMK